MKKRLMELKGSRRKIRELLSQFGVRLYPDGACRYRSVKRTFTGTTAVIYWRCNSMFTNGEFTIYVTGNYVGDKKHLIYRGTPRTVEQFRNFLIVYSQVISGGDLHIPKSKKILKVWNKINRFKIYFTFDIEKFTRKNNLAEFNMEDAEVEIINLKNFTVSYYRKIY